MDKTVEQKFNVLTLKSKEQLTEMLNKTFEIELTWPDYVAIYLELRPLQQFIDLDPEISKKILESQLDWVYEGICQNAVNN